MLTDNLGKEHNSNSFSQQNVTSFRACGFEFCQKSQTIKSFSICNQNKTEKDFDQKEQIPLPKSEQNMPKRSDLKSRDSFSEDLKKEADKDHKNLYIKMVECYNDHKIDQAFKLSLKYKKACKGNKAELSTEESEFIKTINNQMKDVLHYESIINQADWQLQKEKSNLKVSTKLEQNTVGVLIEAQLNIPIEHFLSVLIEVDLMKNFMPFMEESKQEKIISRNCRIGHSLNNFPFLSKRESFFQGIGYDRMDHNRTVILYSRSLNDRPDLQDILNYTVTPTKGTVQLKYRYFVMEYRPTGPKEGSIKMAINVDMNLRLPMWILVPLTQNFGEDFYKNILKIAKDFKGSLWEERAKQNSDFFDLVRRRIEEVFRTNKIDA